MVTSGQVSNYRSISVIVDALLWLDVLPLQVVYQLHLLIPCRWRIIYLHSIGRSELSKLSSVGHQTVVLFTVKEKTIG